MNPAVKIFLDAIETTPGFRSKSDDYVLSGVLAEHEGGETSVILFRGSQADMIAALVRGIDVGDIDLLRSMVLSAETMNASKPTPIGRLVAHAERGAHGPN